MKTAIVLFILINFNYLSAQEFKLTGKVTSENTKETLPFTNVAVFDATSNVLLKYASTDESGTYEMTFKNIDFYMVVELIGFKNYKSDIIKPLGTSKALNIKLIEDNIVLNEVVVMQENNLIKLSGDKMIVDVDKAGFGVGNDALETLTKLPGVRLDKDENLVFRGNGNLQIMIDGKPSLITGEELKQYLKTMDGSNIKKVEIIANPSAKYDASGTAGILNIILKKSVASGLTGNVKTSVGYAEFIKSYNGINLFNSTEKWNFNYGLNYNYNEGVNHRMITQTVENPLLTTTLKQYNDWLPVSNSYSSNFGVSRKLSANANVGGSVNYSIYKSDDLTNGRTNEFDNNEYRRFTILKTDNDILNKILIGGLFYNFSSDSLDTKIDAQLNYANYENNSNQITSNSYFNAATNEIYKNNEIVNYKNPTIFNILSAKLDIERKMTDKINIETGAKYSFVNNDYNIIFKDIDGLGVDVLNSNRSNRLIYKESIFSGYGIANFSRGKFDLQAGLRAEYIDYIATSLTSKASNSNNYLSLFPTFSINGNFDNNQFKFSYSRRIQRPRYLYLNPYFDYVDTYNVSVGNPDLTPQFTNAFEFTWINNQKTSLSFFANFSTDEMYQIAAYDDATKITTLYFDNIGSSKSIGTSFNTSITIEKWWDLQLNTEVSYGQAKSNLPSYQFNDSGVSYYAGINQSFKIAEDWSATWNSFYGKSGDYGNTSFKPSYDTSFGMRKDFFSKKIRLNFSAQNVLKKSQWIQTTRQDNVTTNWTNRWETRKFTLSLTYSFGSAKKKEVKNADLNDEQNRL